MKRFNQILILLTLVLLSVIVIQQFELDAYLEEWFASRSEVSKEVKSAEIGSEKPKVKTKISYKKHIEKGDQRFVNGYHTLAIAEYTLASQVEPSFTEPYIKIGKVHFAEKNYKKALESFRVASQINIDDVESKILIGIAYIHLSEFDKAEKVFNSIEGEDSRIYLYRGLLNLTYSQFEDAKFNLNTALEMDAGGQVSQNASKVLYSFTLYEQSEGSQESYLLTLLAKSLSEINEHNLAIQMVHKVLETSTEYRDAWIILGYSYLRLEKYFDAVSSLEKALEIDSTKPETLYFLGMAQKHKGDLGDAINHLELALRNGFEPKHAVHKELAESYLKNEEYERSVEYYEKLIAENPENLDTFIQAVWIYLDFIGKPEKARSIAETALESHPDNAMTYNLLGWARLKEGDLEGAKEDLEKAIDINENLAAAYLNLGQWYEAQNNLEDAKANYKRAYELEKSTGVGKKASELYNTIIEREAEEISVEETPENTSE